MKKLSYPQLVILLDVLFIFLFILIIKETPPETKIILPDTFLEEGGFLSHEYENGKFRWYNPKFKMWSGAEDNLTNLHDEVGQFAVGIDCQSKCINTIKKRYDIGDFNTNIKVIITNELFDNIARITYLACQTDTKSCGNIVFRINKNWKINKKQLLKENPFLKGIPGIKDNF